MFSFLKPKNSSPLRASAKQSPITEITLKLSGLHCTSCATNIDLTLEDIPGIKSSTTNYAKSEAKIKYDPQMVKVNQIHKAIESLGYSVTLP